MIAMDTSLVIFARVEVVHFKAFFTWTAWW